VETLLEVNDLPFAHPELPSGALGEIAVKDYLPREELFKNKKPSVLVWSHVHCVLNYELVLRNI